MSSPSTSRNESHAFYDKARTEYYDWLKGYSDSIFLALRLASVSDTKFLKGIQDAISAKANLLVRKHMGRVPQNHYSNFSFEMKDSFTKYGKNVFRGDYLITFALRSLDKDHLWQEFNELQHLNIPERATYYLVKSLKCYLVNSYDASIVMAGRAIEYSLKENLRRRKTAFEERSSLHEIWTKFSELFKGGKEPDEVKILHNIEELVRIYRNITAHDNPKTATKEEADVVRSSAKLSCIFLTR